MTTFATTVSILLLPNTHRKIDYRLKSHLRETRDGSKVVARVSMGGSIGTVDVMLWSGADEDGPAKLREMLAELNLAGA